MSLIRRNILLGNYHDAEDLSFLSRNRVTHILNTAAELHPAFPGRFTYRHIFGDDHPGFNLSRHFEEAANFINEALKSGGTVFVHCAAGISRSTSCLIAYFVKYEGMGVSEALSLIRGRRYIVNPNPGFMRQLREYEQKVEARSRNRSRYSALSTKNTPSRFSINQDTSPYGFGASYGSKRNAMDRLEWPDRMRDADRDYERKNDGAERFDRLDRSYDRILERSERNLGDLRTSYLDDSRIPSRYGSDIGSKYLSSQPISVSKSSIGLGGYGGLYSTLSKGSNSKQKERERELFRRSTDYSGGLSEIYRPKTAYTRPTFSGGIASRIIERPTTGSSLRYLPTETPKISDYKRLASTRSIGLGSSGHRLLRNRNPASEASFSSYLIGK